MIAANIGRIFLKAYNEKFRVNYDGKTFFTEKYFPLFFDHNKYLQWITNSPFVQGIKKGVCFSTTERQQKLQILINKIEQGEADASIAIGFPSLDLTATTSGQITNLNLPICKEDVYLSWLGSGLGIGVQGGLSILLDNPQILLDIFDGWQVYRDYLENMPSLRGNQINTWNGQWIAHRYDEKSYVEGNPTIGFNPFNATKDGIEIVTQSWTKVLIAISREKQQIQMLGYVYNLGQTNTTIGFIPFVLPEIRRPIDLYIKLFGMHNLKKAEALFGTQIGFMKACQMGRIGVEALEPKGLREYLDKGKIPKYDNDDEEKTINFNIYQIWILAMLNNDDLWTKARQIAQEFYNYTQGAERAKKDRSNNIKILLSCTNKKTFIEGLIPIVKDVESKDILNGIAQLINVMPIDNVPYFLTLIRFQYAVISNN